MPELYLVRHAQARFGTENYDRLSPLGEQQSDWLGDYFMQKGIEFDAMACGDMRRHKETLMVISNKLGLDPGQQRVLPGFNEYDFRELIQAFGSLFPEDALYRAAVKQMDDKKAFYRLLRRVLQAWSRDEIEGVSESWQVFQQRVEAEKSAIQESANSGGRFLVISSGGAISMFIGLALGLVPDKIIELNLQTRNTGISHFFFNRHQMNLSGFNAIPHLEHPSRTDHITYG